MIFRMPVVARALTLVFDYVAKEDFVRPNAFAGLMRDFASKTKKAFADEKQPDPGPELYFGSCIVCPRVGLKVRDVFVDCSFIAQSD